MLAAFSLGYATGGGRFPASATVCRARRQPHGRLHNAEQR